MFEQQTIVTLFRFRQFQVRQERAAMKICTDATLFGAMAPVNPGDRVLDIGAGTGLLALMTAQLGAADVTAVELTEPAFMEARDNFRYSPWANCLHMVHQDIRDFVHTETGDYDLILSNPPFFTRSSRPHSAPRSIARHADLLPFSSLLAVVAALLKDQGLFYVLLPIQGVAGFTCLAQDVGLYPCSRVDYRGYRHTRPNVAALVFLRSDLGMVLARKLTIYLTEREYTAQAAHYLSPFLPRFAAPADSADRRTC